MSRPRAGLTRPAVAAHAAAPLRVAGAVALAALAVSGQRLAWESGAGALGVVVPPDAGAAWALHRSGAVLLILAVIGALLVTWPWRRLPPGGPATLAEGGTAALAAIRAHLGACLAAAAATAILSGTLLSAQLDAARGAVAAFHAGAGFVLLAVAAAVATLRLLAPSRPD